MQTFNRDSMKPVRIAQIGIGHNHADATMATMRKFPQYFEVVGVAEDDAKWYERRHGLKPYEGLKFMGEEELLATPGLEAVCVEKDVPDIEAAALRCARLRRPRHPRARRKRRQGRAQGAVT